MGTKLEKKEKEKQKGSKDLKSAYECSEDGTQELGSTSFQ